MIVSFVLDALGSEGKTAGLEKGLNEQLSRERWRNCCGRSFRHLFPADRPNARRVSLGHSIRCVASRRTVPIGENGWHLRPLIKQLR